MERLVTNESHNSGVNRKRNERMKDSKDHVELVLEENSENNALDFDDVDYYSIEGNYYYYL